MKKILIALPLVLIMILSMIPVMASYNTTLTVEPVTVYAEPEQKAIAKNEKIQITGVPQDVAEDAKALKKFVEDWFAWNYELPDAREYKYEAKVTPYSAETVETSTVKEYVTVAIAIAEYGATDDNDPELKKDAVLTKEAFERITKTGATEDEKKLEAKDLTEVEEKMAFTDEYQKTVVTEKEVQAKAEIEITPKCESDPVKPTDPCFICGEIEVFAWDVFNQEYVKDLRATYEVENKVYPEFSKLMNDYHKRFVANSGYKILDNWFGQPWVQLPQVMKQCAIVVNVIPALQDIQVLHVFEDCCEDLDGNVTYSTYMTLAEAVQVDFIKYHSELMIDHSKAKEFAKTRIERLNAKDFVYHDAFFKDGNNLGSYLTGKVTDFYGKTYTIKDEAPTIIIKYRRLGCEKTEEKVDNAQVNAGNATTTNTPAAQQLPATGAKDVTAFFMSAVALLGLGIFFAKKH